MNLWKILSNNSILAATLGKFTYNANKTLVDRTKTDPSKLLQIGTLGNNNILDEVAEENFLIDHDSGNFIRDTKDRELIHKTIQLSENELLKRIGLENNTRHRRDVDIFNNTSGQLEAENCTISEYEGSGDGIVVRMKATVVPPCSKANTTIAPSIDTTNNTSTTTEFETTTSTTTAKPNATIPVRQFYEYEGHGNDTDITSASSIGSTSSTPTVTNETTTITTADVAGITHQDDLIAQYNKVISNLQLIRDINYNASEKTATIHLSESFESENTNSQTTLEPINTAYNNGTDTNESTKIINFCESFEFKIIACVSVVAFVILAGVISFAAYRCYQNKTLQNKLQFKTEADFEEGLPLTTKDSATIIKGNNTPQTSVVDCYAVGNVQLPSIFFS